MILTKTQILGSKKKFFKTVQISAFASLTYFKFQS